MAESLARYSDGLPNELHETLYRQWADFGLVITGQHTLLTLVRAHVLSRQCTSQSKSLQTI